MIEEPNTLKRFELKKLENVEFDEAVSLKFGEKNEYNKLDPARYFTNNVGLIALFLDKQTQKEIVVSTAHICKSNYAFLHLS